MTKNTHQNKVARELRIVRNSSVIEIIGSSTWKRPGVYLHNVYRKTGIPLLDWKIKMLCMLAGTTSLRTAAAWMSAWQPHFTSFCWALCAETREGRWVKLYNPQVADAETVEQWQRDSAWHRARDRNRHKERNQTLWGGVVRGHRGWCGGGEGV